jgi:rSAM/selenodomain-associated transferase 1
MLKNLIVFIKNPVIGTVKTRLAKSIGDESALQVYRDLMEKSRKETQEVSADRFLFYSKEIKADNWSTEHFYKQLQAEGDLGFKMKSAFAEVIKKNSKTIIIGSDCYDLTSTIIETAFKELDSNDLVIGPANDGGYYLLGINKFMPELFEEIEWSTEVVLQQTLEKAKQLELKVKCLQELIDIDNIDDLKKSGYSLKINMIND